MSEVVYNPQESQRPARPRGATDRRTVFGSFLEDRE